MATVNLLSKVANSLGNRDQVIKEVKKLDQEQRKLVLTAFQRGISNTNPTKIAESFEKLQADQACIHLLGENPKLAKSSNKIVSFFIGFANIFFGRISSAKVADAILTRKVTPVPVPMAPVVAAPTKDELFQQAKNDLEADLSKAKDIHKVDVESTKAELKKIQAILVLINGHPKTSSSPKIQGLIEFLHTEKRDHIEMLANIKGKVSSIKAKINDLNLKPEQKRILTDILTKIETDCKKKATTRSDIGTKLEALSGHLQKLSSDLSVFLTFNVVHVGPEVGFYDDFSTQTVPSIIALNEDRKSLRNLETQLNAETRNITEAVEKKKQYIDLKTQFANIDGRTPQNLQGNSAEDMVEIINAYIELESSSEFSSDIKSEAFINSGAINALADMRNEFLKAPNPEANKAAVQGMINQFITNVLDAQINAQERLRSTAAGVALNLTNQIGELKAKMTGKKKPVEAPVIAPTVSEKDQKRRALEEIAKQVRGNRSIYGRKPTTPVARLHAFNANLLPESKETIYGIFYGLINSKTFIRTEDRTEDSRSHNLGTKVFQGIDIPAYNTPEVWTLRAQAIEMYKASIRD